MGLGKLVSIFYEPDAKPSVQPPASLQGKPTQPIANPAPIIAPSFTNAPTITTPGDPYTPDAVYGFLVKEDAEKKFAEEEKWMDRWFHPTNYIEQSVHNNSIAFHDFLKENNIDYRPNGHLTTIIGNHDKFELGVAFGKKWAEWEASQK